jgi:hypothetical protein
VVTVSSSGEVIANTLGSVVITATTLDVATSTINVVEALPDLPWFEDLADGSTLDTGVTAWSTSINQGVWDVRDGLLLLSPGSRYSIAVWSSECISLTGHENLTISIDVDDLDASKESNDYVKVYYKLDDGPLIPFGTVTGNIDLITFTASDITGSVLELVAETQVSWSGQTYSIDNVNVSGIIEQKDLEPSLSSFDNTPKDAYIIYPNPVSDVLNI